MVDRSVLSCNARGAYSELLVAAAFIADGFDVGLPFGNQAGWDLVVRGPESVWITVQVKTVSPLEGRAYPRISLSRAGRKGKQRNGELRGRYTERDADLIVAVHPETGTLWKVPACEFSGRGGIRLVQDFIWRGNISEESFPLGKPPRAISVIARAAIEKQSRSLFEERAAVRNLLPAERPEWASSKSWALTKGWCEGAGYKSLGAGVGICGPAARERVVRVLSRLGLMNMPGSISKKDRRPPTPLNHKHLQSRPRDFYFKPLA